MSRLLIIGCGGVASVAVHKCCQNSEVFTEIMIASRTVSKCEALKAELEGKTSTKITTAQVDADNVDELAALMESYKPDAVLNLALPYQDLTIMDACLKAGVNYIDTANYEPEDTDDPEWRAIYEKRCKEEGFTAYFDYSWQWAYKERFEKAGLMALLGTGFDPGVTSVFTAYALKHYFDEIHTIDILDCNGGDHGYPFATNFNPEINLREVSANGSYWENGHWVETEPMEIKREYNFPQVGQKDMYLLHHEEIEALLERHGPMMAYVVRGILSDPHEQEECLAQVRARVWERWETYDREKASPATWLTALCRNAAYDRLRTQARQRERAGTLDETMASPAPGPEEVLLQKERLETLSRLLSAMSAGDRALFYRKYYYLQSTEQMAAELGTTARAVEGRLYRIRKKLQKQMGGELA